LERPFLVGAVWGRRGEDCVILSWGLSEGVKKQTGSIDKLFRNLTVRRKTEIRIRGRKSWVAFFFLNFLLRRENLEHVYMSLWRVQVWECKVNIPREKRDILWVCQEIRAPWVPSPGKGVLALRGRRGGRRKKVWKISIGALETKGLCPLI
jgi:hypothetical protein